MTENSGPRKNAKESCDDRRDDLSGLVRDGEGTASAAEMDPERERPGLARRTCLARVNKAGRYLGRRSTPTRPHRRFSPSQSRVHPPAFVVLNVRHNEVHHLRHCPLRRRCHGPIHRQHSVSPLRRCSRAPPRFAHLPLRVCPARMLFSASPSLLPGPVDLVRHTRRSYPLIIRMTDPVVAVVMQATPSSFVSIISVLFLGSTC